VGYVGGGAILMQIALDGMCETRREKTLMLYLLRLSLNLAKQFKLGFE